MTQLATGLTSKAQAIDLLTRTSTCNQTGRIGSPWSRQGYTLAEAVEIIGRADPERISIQHQHGIPILTTTVPGFGVHAWYLVMEPRRVDPWA